jgi:hypothetical protein
MAGGFTQQSLNGGLHHAYLRSHPVLSFHRRLRSFLLPARPGVGRRRAGLSAHELSIVAKENTLTIKGEKAANENGQAKAEVLYRGIAARAFERAFQLADFVQVKNASLENGLLHVDLVREIPEAKKPRSIPITTNAVAAPQVVDGSAEKVAA